MYLLQQTFHMNEPRGDMIPLHHHSQGNSVENKKNSLIMHIIHTEKKGDNNVSYKTLGKINLLNYFLFDKICFSLYFIY